MAPLPLAATVGPLAAVTDTADNVGSAGSGGYGGGGLAATVPALVALLPFAVDWGRGRYTLVRRRLFIFGK